ncbi:MAG: hypothetical protein P8X89_22480 [Reinekea sp.]
MLPKNWGEPMGAPAIFEKQIEIFGVTDSGYCYWPDALRCIVQCK